MPREAEKGETAEKDYGALPDHVVIRNTFIDTKPQRSPSLERLLGERRIRSSPPSVMHDVRDSQDPFGVSAPGSWAGDLEEEEEEESPIVHFNWPLRAAGLDIAEAAKAAIASSNAVTDRDDENIKPAFPPTFSGETSTTTAGGSGRISEEGKEEREREEAVVGSAEMPSRGSALHRWGACKPCAFVVHGVCRNDIQCEFCHLCEPGEKKRRRKEWLESKRESRKLAREMNQQLQQMQQMQLGQQMIPAPL